MSATLSLEYDLEFGEPEVLDVPFVHSKGGLADALFGLAIELPPFLRPGNLALPRRN